MAFLAGLMGGVHCLGMCGGIVAAMSLQGSRQQHLPIMLGYNAGRIISYALAGAMAGLIGSAAFLSETLFPVQIGLYILAQVMLILVGFYLAGLNQSVLLLEKAGGMLWSFIQPRLGRLLPVDGFGKAFMAGSLWGWLPCGLVYSVMVTALASGEPDRGALLMLAFGAGTLPNLLAMGWAADRLKIWFRRRAVRLGAGLTVAGFGFWGLARLALNG